MLLLNASWRGEDALDAGVYKNGDISLFIKQIYYITEIKM